MSCSENPPKSPASSSESDSNTVGVVDVASDACTRNRLPGSTYQLESGWLSGATMGRTTPPPSRLEDSTIANKMAPEAGVLTMGERAVLSMGSYRRGPQLESTLGSGSYDGDRNAGYSCEVRHASHIASKKRAHTEHYTNNTNTAIECATTTTEFNVWFATHMHTHTALL